MDYAVSTASMKWKHIAAGVDWKHEAAIRQNYGSIFSWREEGGKEVARLAGIEPTTLGFGGQYSIH